MQQTEKIGFLQMLRIAVAKPKEYQSALKVKKRTIVGFVLLVTFIIVFLGTIIPFLSFGVSIGGPKHFITETLPAFKYQDGTFHIDRRVEIDDNSIRIIADSDVDQFTSDDLEEDTIMEVLISKNNIQMKNSLTGQGNTNLDFKDLGSITFTNEDMLEYLPLLYLGIAVGTLGVWFGSLYQYLISALIFAVCGRSIARTMKKNLSFGQCYIFALMAKVTIEIINSMGAAADLSFINSMVWIFISFGIVMAYMYFGIKEIGGANHARPEF